MSCFQTLWYCSCSLQVYAGKTRRNTESEFWQHSTLVNMSQNSHLEWSKGETLEKQGAWSNLPFPALNQVSLQYFTHIHNLNGKGSHIWDSSPMVPKRIKGPLTLPGLAVFCMQFWETIVGWTDVDALWLRSMTDGEAEVGCWRAGWWGLWSCWAGLGGMPFSERNSSRSMYSNWKVSPS